MIEEKMENSNVSENIKEKTFNKLCELQKLIQKESALKQICKSQ